MYETPGWRNTRKGEALYVVGPRGGERGKQRERERERERERAESHDRHIPWVSESSPQAREETRQIARCGQFASEARERLAAGFRLYPMWNHTHVDISHVAPLSPVQIIPVGSVFGEIFHRRGPEYDRARVPLDTT